MRNKREGKEGEGICSWDSTSAALVKKSQGLDTWYALYEVALYLSGCPDNGLQFLKIPSSTEMEI